MNERLPLVSFLRGCVLVVFTKFVHLASMWDLDLELSRCLIFGAGPQMVEISACVRPEIVYLEQMER